MIAIPTQIVNFHRAFTTGVTGCVDTCDCDRVFYDTYNDYDWGEGELEQLGNNPGATALDYSVSQFYWGGRYYCCDCDCWKSTVDAAITAPANNASQIIEYYGLEQTRKEQEFKDAPSLYPVNAGWREMHDAPRDSSYVDLFLKSEKVVEKAHWACNLSGEEQPPFKGWFIKSGSGYAEVKGTPVAWKYNKD